MTDTEISYKSAVEYARRHITDCCYGRPCLEDCLRRLGASLPPCACAGGWRPPRWAKWLVLAAVLAVFVFAAFHASAEVQCIWDGSTYVCSGEGNRVEVIGGGDGGPVAVTNFWGVCTNCVSMSPSYCESFKSDIKNEISSILLPLDSIFDDAYTIRGNISGIEDDISTFRRFGTVRNLTYAPSAAGSLYRDFSNYVYTVENTQTSLDRSYITSFSSAYPRVSQISYNDGIYDYAQTLTNPFLAQKAYTEGIMSNASGVRDRITILGDSIDHNLICDQCQAEYESGPNPGGGGSGSGGASSIVTNGNWCTFEQGEAIKSLLGDLKTWAERQHSQLSAISNYVRSSYETLRSGLYSDYTAIPRGEDWQNLYLNGQPTGWGYDPTNIIQRIEVLLYGISGISTNTPSLDDSTSSAEDTVNDVSDATASIATDADGTAATTLGNAVVNFFRAFSPRTKNYQGGEEIIAEVSIKVGDDTHYVPAMRLGSSGFLVDTMTAVRTLVNGFCSVLFWVGGAFVIFRFWAWFSAWCIRLSKWAVELCTSLFAS